MVLEYMDIMEDLNRKIIGARRRPTLAVLFAAGAILVSGCSSDPTSEDTSAFKEEVNAAVLAPGDVSGVPRVDSELRDEYDSYSEVDGQGHLFSDGRATLTDQPRRYETPFTAGDGSGADTVCRDVELPKDTKYVFVVRKSDHDATAWVDSEGKDDSKSRELHICYDADNHPSNVMAWFSNEPR